MWFKVCTRRRRNCTRRGCIVPNSGYQQPNRIWCHGRPQHSFLGWAKYHFNAFHSQFQIQISYFDLKFHKCQISGPGKCQVLPIGADTHVWCGIFEILFNWIFEIVLLSKYPFSRRLSHREQIQSLKYWKKYFS